MYRSKLQPSEPPCLFPNIPSSCLSPPPPKARKTTLASASKRNVLPDELERFYEQDLLVIEIIPEKLAEELHLVVQYILDYPNLDYPNKVVPKKLRLSERFLEYPPP